MCVYLEDRQYSRTKAYSASDKKTFSHHALKDAVRIMKQLKRTKGLNLPTLADKLEVCGIPQEETLGLEHLIFEDLRRIYKRRRSHTRAILQEQKLNEGSCDDSYKLAELSTSLAAITVSEARKRAARAA